MADHRPVPYQAAPPSRRDRPLPQVRGGDRVPLHQPQSLSFVDAAGTREELWEQLSAKVRQRVEARFGQLLEWWADQDDQGRVTAAVLGDQALVTVEPTVNASGSPAYRVAGLPLDPSSFRTVTVTGPTDLTGPAPDRSPPGQGGPGSSPVHPGGRIPPELAGLLGYLPVRAQTLLQEPFRTSQADLDWRYHYLRQGHGGGLAAANLRVWCYLTDLRSVTFTAGTGYGYRDGTGADAWQLTCWRASRR